MRRAQQQLSVLVQRALVAARPSATAACIDGLALQGWARAARPQHQGGGGLLTSGSGGSSWGRWGEARFFSAGGGARPGGSGSGGGSGQASSSAASTSTSGSGAAAASAAAAAAAARSPFDRWLAGLRAVPPVARLLGFAGIVPFIALAPPVSKHLFWILPFDVIDNSAAFQVAYGASIVSFLGAVHWGYAMSSPAMASPLLARAAREAYLWSVFPSLSSFWLAAIEPAPASLLLCVLLTMCYAVDRARAKYLPAWYMALRAPLTLGASYGLLLTATYYLYLDADRAAAAEAARAQAQAAAGGSGGAGGASSSSSSSAAAAAAPPKGKIA